MVSLPVLQNYNHFECSYNPIFIEQSFLCVPSAALYTSVKDQYPHAV